MLKAIDSDQNNTYYLEQAIRSGDDVERLKKYTAAVQGPYEAFKVFACLHLLFFSRFLHFVSAQ